ncbi:MAG: ATP-binding cassette domain-containing protein [Longimicrobiales bacterium]|nr:ATP-binding cassette domain-containing protein [Longimicrobiales bacterium]
MNAPAIRLHGVTKRFGDHTAVRDLDLEIPEGTICGLLGPNGSGKTTTIRMILGIYGPDRGTVELFGGSPDHRRRRRVGYLPEERGMYRTMKLLDHLVFIGEIRGMRPREGRRRGMAWLERLGLSEWADRRVEDLSRGMQQKAHFIATVLHEPDLLILDEPFSGLDPINQDLLESIVLELNARGATILFSTHLMDQAERLCRRVCLISCAEKVLDGDLREIRRAEDRGDLHLVFEGDEGWLATPEVATATRAGEGWRLTLAPGIDPQRILARAVEAGVEMRRFERVEPRLHEIFVRHARTGDSR